jgi:ATP-dependent Lon protease
MSEELDKDIREAINKNLPSAVASELKTFIEVAEKRRITIAQLEDRIRRTEEEKRTLSSDKYLLEKELVQVNTLLDKYRVRERELSSAEEKIHNAEVNAKVASARMQGMYEVISMVFANNIVKTNIHNNTQVPVVMPGNPQYGSGPYVASHQQSEDKTEIVEG